MRRSEALSQTAKRRTTPEARSPGRRLDARGLLCPAECQVRGDMGSPFPFGKGHEVLQQAARLAELASQVTAELKVLLGGFAQRAHSSPPFVGHGSASERRPRTSTFA